MEGLTLGEQRLFAKYWGRQDLVDDEEFWKDAYDCFKADGDVLLPLEYTPFNARHILEMLNCQKCGTCCRYEKIPVSQHDIDRIVEHTKYSDKDIKKLVQTKDNGFMYLKGCPFLGKNRCTIYDYRPDVCYFFPLQSGMDAVAGGKKIRQMRIRIKCLPSMNIVREVLTEAVRREGMLLLPNLMLVGEEQ